MSGVALGIAAAAAVVGTGYAIYNGEQTRSAQGDAARKAEENAKKTQQMQQEQINKANARKPDIAAMLSGNETAAKGGQSGTMLTGPQGVDPNSLSLSKNTLLGG